MFSLTVGSLWNRRFVAMLTIASIALSVALILGVERLRGEARESFANSASGIDLIVASRGSPIQILMATIFGVGSTGAGISWDTFEMVQERPEVAWAIPIQMGDNHKGFPVVGTTRDYFKRFKHSGGRALVFAEGRPFDYEDVNGAVMGAVIGAEVATRFGYSLGDVIINAHGAGDVSFQVHKDAPFTITGILTPTGTAVDRLVLVSLKGFDALHAKLKPQSLDPFSAPVTIAQSPRDYAKHPDETEHESHEHASESLNAVFVGLTDRAAVLGVQRALVDYPGEAIIGVMPNLALLELWSITGTAENVLRLMAWAVALVGITGMVVMLSATMDARRREFAILRSVGATPARIFSSIVMEAAVLSGSGIVLGLVLLTLATLIADPILSAHFGIHMGLNLISLREATYITAAFAAGLLAALVPAFQVYRVTLADGLSPRL